MSAPPVTDPIALDTAAQDLLFRTALVINIGHPGPDAWTDRLPRLTHDDVVHTV